MQSCLFCCVNVKSLTLPTWASSCNNEANTLVWNYIKILWSRFISKFHLNMPPNTDVGHEALDRHTSESNVLQKQPLIWREEYHKPVINNATKWKKVWLHLPTKSPSGLQDTRLMDIAECFPFLTCTKVPVTKLQHI